MRQHDVFANPIRGARAALPLVVNLQADGAGGDQRIIAPLASRSQRVGRIESRALPAVLLDDQEFVVMLTLLGTIQSRRLGPQIGSIAHYRDDLTRALDWLLWGV